MYIINGCKEIEDDDERLTCKSNDNSRSIKAQSKMRRSS